MDTKQIRKEVLPLMGKTLLIMLLVKLVVKSGLDFFPDFFLKTLVETFFVFAFSFYPAYKFVVIPLLHLHKIKKEDLYQKLQDIISEKAQAEKTLAQKNVFLDFLLDSSQLGVWYWNVKTNRVDFDKNWLGMLGLPMDTPKELATWQALVHPDDLNQAYVDINDCISGKVSVYKNIHRLKHADGSWRYILDQGKIFKYDKDGSPLIFSGTHLDITFLKNLEQTLEASQKVAKLGTWQFDVATKKPTWSKELFAIFEYPETEAPSVEEHMSLIFPEDRKRWEDAINDSIVNKKPYFLKYKIITRSGQVKHLESHGDLEFNHQGKLVKLFGTCQDISQRVQSEISLAHEKNKSIQSAKLASLGELAAGIAHEINNPLTIISGNLMLLERQEEVSPEIKKRVENINKAVNRMSKIILGLKKFSRSAETAEKNIHSLAYVLEDMQVLVELKSKSHGVEVSLDYEPNLFIECNEVELGQVFINLVNNGIDAIKDKPNPWVKVSAKKEGDMALIQFIDSGNGLPSHLVKKLFEPFFTTKPVGEGTGLGLSISKGIIEDHKGSLVINSDLENTCFEVRLPLKAKPS